MQKIVPTFVLAGLGVIRAMKRSSPGGKKITRAERDQIISDALGRLAEDLEASIPVED